MRKGKLVILALFLLFGLLACGSSTSILGKRFNEQKVAALKKGETTEQEVLKWFGAPSKNIVTQNGRMWEYLYVEITSVAGGLGGTDSTRHTLSIFFNKKGVVIDYDRKHSKGSVSQTEFLSLAKKGSL